MERPNCYFFYFFIFSPLFSLALLQLFTSFLHLIFTLSLAITRHTELFDNYFTKRIFNPIFFKIFSKHSMPGDINL